MTTSSALLDYMYIDAKEKANGEGRWMSVKLTAHGDIFFQDNEPNISEIFAWNMQHLQLETSIIMKSNMAILHIYWNELILVNILS